MLPWLKEFPDRLKAELLYQGFKVGFHIPEYTGLGCEIIANSKSVIFRKEIVQKKIDAEIQLGRIAGPFSSPPFTNFRISPLSIVPKKEPNSYRLIHNLSYPKKFSLNDVTDKSHSKVEYASFDDALNFLRFFGQGALMSKTDIKSAFRLLPIIPSGFNSLGFYFNDSFYFDKCLPMGYTLSCFYFEAFSTFLNWVIDSRIGEAKSLHYLDDFLFVGKPDASDCFSALTKFIEMSEFFGIPLAEEKTVFPTTQLEFLGISINSVTMEFSLPFEKIVRINTLLDKIIACKKTTLKELQSLLGLLVFTARVIPMGRVFTKRLYKATCGKKSPYAHIRITKSMREDLNLWSQFLKKFNGHCIWQDDFVSSSSYNLFTDAAGSIGYGAFFMGHWSAAKWPDLWFQRGFTKNIVLLELFPVLVAIHIWGDYFKNKRILLHSDNRGVVYAINCQSAKSEPVVTILRHIVLQCLNLNLWLKASYLKGERNIIADSLSRLQMDKFWEIVPDADPVGAPCPQELWDLLLI